MNHTTHNKIRLLIIAAILVLAAASHAQAEGRQALLRNIAWQAALDGVGYSPGIIDGRVGPKTRLATREFQRVRGLQVTGELDSATAEALKIDLDKTVARYTVTQADLDEIGPTPTSWKQRSRLKRLGHRNLADALCEKFHCAGNLLATLNPGKDINKLKPGDTLIVPYVTPVSPDIRAEVIEINLADKVIRVIDKDQKLVGLFHCSVAKDKAKMPSGTARVTCAVPDPHYTFKPKMWPEVREDIDQPLDIPPGPRNPVGRFWIGLSLPGYGIHGTPNPELIGKTGSHGCFRLANWDAIRLGAMVRAGVRVRFTDHPDKK